MKEQIIQIPDTLEIKEIKDNKIILVEKEKKLTYEDIARKLFSDKGMHYYTDSGGVINAICNAEYYYHCKNNATSKKQVEKLLAINMLMNVAKYLNDGWQPDWNNRSDEKWSIKINNDKILTDYCDYQYGDIFFKSKELVEQAIEILGEETIRLALCTDY